MRSGHFFLVGLAVFANLWTMPAAGQQYRRFTRTPYYNGPNDPEKGKIRGTIKLGETVIIDMPGDTGDTDLKPGVVPDPNITPPRGSRPGGPFELEGVKPGDWIAIHILDLQPGPYGYSNNHSMVRGPLRVLTPVKDGMVMFPPDFAIPMRPMIGVIHFKSASALPFSIWDSGGNLDFNSVRKGATVYIKSQVYGAMLTLGDAHAYMSDGELTGTGVEIDMTVTLKCERVPGFPNAGVIVETEDRWYTAGIGANWEEAVKVAWSEAVMLTSHLYSVSAEHANTLVGTIGDTVPGYAAGKIFHRGFDRPSYITVQIAMPKALKRTGKKTEQ